MGTLYINRSFYFKNSTLDFLSNLCVLCSVVVLLAYVNNKCSRRNGASTTHPEMEVVKNGEIG